MALPGGDPYDYGGGYTRRAYNALGSMTSGGGGSFMRLDNLGMVLIFAGIALWATSRVVARA